MTGEHLGRFGHHPDPAIDFCVEVEIIEGMAYDARVGTITRKTLEDRVFRAMTFNVGGDAGAVNAKGTLRAIDNTLRIGDPDA